MTVECDETHIYRVDGRIVPGFHEILDDLGFPKNHFWTEAGREEGTALSQWALFLASGKEPANSPNERIAGRVEGFRRFLDEFQIAKFIDGERPLYNSALGYCCTPDLWFNFGDSSFVLEVKGGSKMKRHRLQTVAQAMALAENNFPVETRYCLYLKDGGYDLDEHDDPEDEHCWRALVAAYYAKKEY